MANCLRATLLQNVAKNPKQMVCSELSRGCSCKLLTRNPALNVHQKSNKMTCCFQLQTHYAQPCLKHAAEIK